MKKLIQYLNRLLIITIVIAISSCVKKELIIEQPKPSETPVVVTYPQSGWHPDYDKWLDKHFDEAHIGAITQICPNNSQSSREAWKTFWRAIVKAESGFNRASRYTENLGIDYITKKQVVSEGLFQLSYQDLRGYPECKVFNWEADKLKSDKDISKTIFDAKNQFVCAMAIANKLGSQGRALGAYWSTARHTSTPGKRIYSELAQKFPSCYN